MTLAQSGGRSKSSLSPSWPSTRRTGDPSWLDAIAFGTRITPSIWIAVIVTMKCGVRARIRGEERGRR